MTCETVLELLLDAEPSALVPDENTPLGAHLRDCGRCRRLGAQLLADHRLLATGVDTVRQRVRSRQVRRMALVPVFVMAVIALLLVRRQPSAEVRSVAPVVVVGAAPVRPTLNAQRSTENTQRSTLDAQRQALVRAFPKPVPVMPVRFEPSAPRRPTEAVAPAGVTVDPPPGMRAAVMRTGDPKLVVVWLY